MSEPFLGEIRTVAFTYAPKGWATCDGQILPIAQNQALFALLGTTYGGNGVNTFALPDLRGKVGVGQGVGPGLLPYILGQQGGQSTHSLTLDEIPAHTHSFAVGTAAASTADPTQGVYAKPASPVGAKPLYGDTGDALFSPSMVQSSGGSQPHENKQPYLVILFVIALQGIFPSRN